MALSTALIGGCTGAPATEDPPASPRTQAPPVVSQTAYVFTDEAGIEARLTVVGSGTTLSVANETDASLPVPGIYILDARDGRRVPWKVLGAAPVAAGETVTFDVGRPPGSDEDQIGLVAMLFGGEDLGAFVPPQLGNQ